MQVSVVMPVLNEEQALGSILPLFQKIFSRQNISYEIVVCDNGSTDSSIAVCNTYGVKVVNEVRKGYGFALKRAIAEAKGDVIVTLDADGTYPVEMIPALYSQFKSLEVDFLITNRFTHQYLSLGTMPFINRIGNSFLSFVVRRLFAINVIDSQSGMILFNKKFQKACEGIAYNSFDFCQSLKLTLIKKYNARYAEVEIPYYHRIGKKKLNVIKDGFRNIFALFRLKYER